MAEKKMSARIINKHDTESNWNNKPDFVPMNGELIIYEPDTNENNTRFKVGDGVTNVTSLPFCNTPEVILKSSTEGSKKMFKLSIDDYGTLSVVEV